MSHLLCFIAGMLCSISTVLFFKGEAGPALGYFSAMVGSLLVSRMSVKESK